MSQFLERKHSQMTKKNLKFFLSWGRNILDFTLDEHFLRNCLRSMHAYSKPPVPCLNVHFLTLWISFYYKFSVSHMYCTSCLAFFNTMADAKLQCTNLQIFSDKTPIVKAWQPSNWVSTVIWNVIKKLTRQVSVLKEKN